MTNHKSPVRILLVEDSANDRELVLLALQDYNLANQVDIARDGREALAMLFDETREPFCGVVFLDLKLPFVDGLEVLAQIRAHPRLGLTPVVIMTTSNQESDLIRAWQLGVNAYVVKPLGFEAFARCIKEVGYFWTVTNTLPSVLPPPA